MSYSRSKEIDVTIQITKNGVGIYTDIECTALVDYDVIDGELEWVITGFKFSDHNGTVVIGKDDEFQFNQLKSGLDDSQIESALNGELTHTFDSDSGLCNRSRLTA